MLKNKVDKCEIKRVKMLLEKESWTEAVWIVMSVEKMSPIIVDCILFETD